MKACLFTFFCVLVFNLSARAQAKAVLNQPVVINACTDSEVIPFNDDDEIRPTFPGGLKQFYKYLKKNIHYPGNAVKQHIKGVVRLNFVVEKDGSIKTVSVVKGVGKEIDAETIRVVKNSPKWHPGLEHGKPVKFLYGLPVRFGD